MLAVWSSPAWSAKGKPQRLAPPLAEQALLMTQSEHAEVLYSAHKTQLSANGDSEQVHYYSIRVLDETAAQDYQTLFLPYNSDSQTIRLDFAHIYQPETANKSDTLLDISEQILITDKPLSTQVNKLQLNQIEADKTLSLFARALTVGDIIEFQYRINSQAQNSLGVFNQTVSPYWLQVKANTGHRTHPLASPASTTRADSVQHFQFELISPESIKVQSQILAEPEKLTPLVKVNNNQISKSWQGDGFTKLSLHPFMPDASKALSPVQVCAFCNGQNKQAFYEQWQLIQSKPEPLQKFIRQLKQTELYLNASNKSEQLKAVYAYIRQQIALQPTALSSHSFLPVSAEQTILKRHGNDKDIAQLMVEILPELDIQAEFAWLDLQAAALKQDTPEFADLVNFDQAIVYIPAQSDLSESWLNPSSELTYPGMDAHLVGHSAAVFSKAKQAIQFNLIQANALPDNLAELALQYYPGTSELRKIQLELKVQGWYEQYFRALVKQDNEQLNNSSLIKRKLLALFNSEADIELDYQVQQLSSEVEPLSIQATYLFNQPKNIYTAGVNSAQMFNFLSSFEALPMPQQADSGYDNPLNYQARLQAKFMAYPERIASLYQSSVSQQSPYFTFNQQGQFIEDDYLIKFNYQQPALKLESADYQAYLNDIQALSQLDAWLISFRVNPKVQAQEKLNNALAQVELQNVEKQSIEQLIIKAEYAISQSQFEQAIELAKQALDKQEQHAKAWYVLATALGFNGEVKAAKAAFKQADKFGFSWEPTN